MDRLIWPSPRTGIMQQSPFVFNHSDAVKRARRMNKLCQTKIIKAVETTKYFPEEIHSGRKWESVEECLNVLRKLESIRKRHG